MVELAITLRGFLCSQARQYLSCLPSNYHLLIRIVIAYLLYTCAWCYDIMVRKAELVVVLVMPLV